MSGRGTFSGTVFQATVGACAAGLLLTERPLSRLGGGLPGTPKLVLLETPTAVDDVHLITDVGEVFVQAKNSLSLSTLSDSELASVANQFVRQYREGAQENGKRRDLYPSRDRLVLAVGQNAPATVTGNLREALDRNRTGAATDLPEAIAEALQTFTNQLEAAWHAVTGSALPAVDRISLLSLCSVVAVGESQRQLVEESLTTIVARPGEETALFDLLFTWASDAAQRGTGGDATAIRLALQGRIALAAPPSFQPDLARLLAYSAEALRHLERFATFTAPEGTVRLARPVVARVAEAAHHGALALTGEPGAGKSAVLFALAGELQLRHPVVCMTVETGAGTLDLLRAEIGLQHPLVEVLRCLPRPFAAYLLVDALDASRGGAAEDTYRKLIEAVQELPGWHVVASVRSFDLRLGPEWQRLFRGAPLFPEYADAGFTQVHHLHIGLLTGTERAELARQSPSLDAALTAGGARLETLALNTFNLALLAELISGGTLPQELTTVATRGQLLTRYWHQRVQALGTQAVVAVARLVEQMLQEKALTVSLVRVEAATAAGLELLQRAGVLMQPSSSQIGFRHHVLFDYAVATLLLLPSSDPVPGYLRREQAAGLLLAPALGYWVEELKNTRQDFWELVADLVADEGLDPLVRVEVARLAVETVQPDEELTQLAFLLGSPEPQAARVFQQLAGALLTKAEAGQPLVAAPWAQLLGTLTLADDAQQGRLQGLIKALLNQALTAGARANLGTAVRALYVRVAAHDALTRWLAQRVIPLVVRTYDSDVQASRQLLRLLFSPERFARFGYFEVPALAQELLTLAAADVDLAVELVARIFQGHNFRRDQVTPWGQSWILSFSSNEAQDFDSAKHRVVKAFPALLQLSPATATRAFAAALHSRWQTSSWRSRSTGQTMLPMGSSQLAFEEDGSSTWAWDLEEGRHTPFAKMHEAFRQWVADLQDAEVLNALPKWLLRETPAALAWRVLFAVGILHPQSLGQLLWPAAAQLSVLISADTQQQAIQLLATIYPHLSSTAREEAEMQWLQGDFSAFPDPGSKRKHTLAPLFQEVGEAQLVTPAAQKFLRSANPPGGVSPSNASHFIRARRLDPSELGDEDEESPLESWHPLVRAAESARVQVEAGGTPEVITRFAVAIWDLDQVASQLPTEDAGAAQCIANLAEFLGILVRVAGESDTRNKALTRLLELTHYPEPATDADTEADFAASGIQPIAYGRPDAAQALGSLAASSQLWPRIAARFEAMLLCDPHPQVRWRLVTALSALVNVVESTAWDLATKFAQQEQNPVLCQHALSAARRLAKLDPVRAEPIVLALTNKADVGSPRSDAGAYLLVMLAVDKALPASGNLLQTWIADYANREQQLTSVLFAVQHRFPLGYSPSETHLVAVRHRTIALVHDLITTVEPAITAWTTAERQPTEGEITAVKLLDHIAKQLFFTVCSDEFSPSFSQLTVQRQFLRDYTPLIRKLTVLGTPGAIHHLMDVLGRLMPADPAVCFDLLSEAILRTTGVAKYEHEWMGADRFVELIGRYLADHRSIFTHPTRQKRLIDSIAVFVEAGWPEARRLFHELPKLLQ
jgi:hypothetical protein